MLENTSPKCMQKPMVTPQQKLLKNGECTMKELVCQPMFNIFCRDIDRQLDLLQTPPRLGRNQGGFLAGLTGIDGRRRAARLQWLDGLRSLVIGGQD
jgi:hypothetical protein